MAKIGLLIKITIGLFALLALLSVFLVSSLFSEHPSVTMPDKLTANELSRVKTLLDKNNPANFKYSHQNKTQLSDQDIKLITAYIAHKSSGRLRTEIKLFNKSVFLTSSIHIAVSPFGHYLNVSTGMIQTNEQLVIEFFKINNLEISQFIANKLMLYTHNKLKQRLPEYKLANTMLKSLNFRKNNLAITYDWRPEFASQVKTRLASTLISDELRKKIIIYTRKLQTITSSISSSSPSLNDLLRPMFLFAASRNKTNNPIEENRALFLVLGGYMLNKNLAHLIGDDTVANLPKNKFRLLDRKDLSKHFLISSALTAASNSKIAHSIGLDKEIKDADGGSGFSFADLAADQAGIILATTALQSKQSAILIQNRMSLITHENDYMPRIDNLPEGLQKIDFQKVYKNTSSHLYYKVNHEIDKRITSCTIYSSGI